MYINRALALLMIMLYVFAPPIQEWVLTGGTAWYRPFIVWAVAIALVYWAQRGGRPNV